MNELPIIGYPYYAQRTLGLSGENFAGRYKEMYSEELFRYLIKLFWGEDQRFFAVVLSQMDLGNVDTWKM